MKLKNIFLHLHTVNEHRFFVFINCLKAGIPFRGLVHDLSKYSPSEFFESAKYFNGHHSPIVEERLNKGGYSDIFIHHTRRNKHHYEYWVDLSKGDILLKKMPYKYSVEFVCDMIAASHTYLKKDFKRDEPLKFFMKRYDTYFIHSATKEFIKTLLESYASSNFKFLKKKYTKPLYQKIMKNTLIPKLSSAIH